MKPKNRILLLLLFCLCAGACRGGLPVTRENTDAANAVRQLDRVRVAVSVKAPRNEYDLVLSTAQRAVSEKLAVLPESELKQEIAATLKAYQDAGQVWAQQDKPDAAANLWQTADTHLNKAKELLTRENRIF